MPTMKPRHTLAALLLVAACAALSPVLWNDRSRSTVESGKAMQAIDPERPCGVVCVALTSHLLGQPVALSRAKEVVSVDGLGRTSLAQVVDGLRGLGFSAIGVKLDARSLGQLTGTPVILYVNRGHFVVALPVGNGSAVLVDPPHPVRCTSLRALAGQWSGEAVLVQDSRNKLRTILESLGIRDAEDRQVALWAR
jgi:ABC-type bacteriocin/lantibiotic exporter with double-glycine peptidase domain